MTFFPKLSDALKSESGLMDLLRRDAQAKKNRVSGWRPSRDVEPEPDRHYMVRDDFLLPSHPDSDTLNDYVLDSLPDEKMREVIDHLSECEQCSREVIEIRRLDKEITKDFRDWMKGPLSHAKGPASDETK